MSPSPSKPPAPKAAISAAAEPRYGRTFDPWNSSSTGHQRAENRLGGSTGWRQSRNTKLHSQFRGGAGGGPRVSDTVGAGSKDWDSKAQALIPPELRSRARTSVADMLARPGIMKSTILATAGGARPNRHTKPGGNDEDEDDGAGLTAEERLTAQRKAEDEAKAAAKPEPRKILDSVVVYVNGSTHPLISDHKLKQVLAEHGGKTSLHLGRRQVTHVILGRPAGGTAGAGAGGGLAGGKLQREIQKVGGRGIKFVGVEWVLESVREGKRLPEARFSNLKIAAKGQQSVYGLYSHTAARSSRLKNDDDDDNEPPPSGQR
ncbi:hypothetical protein F4778DRAFT_159744 [Xylariomycetidae sp. FL2044]|nr:hypothetical protein F4778DRAFT_159744 [Xylariomycetidae sp. FL2044]